MRIALIKERKNPPDTRVALTPEQCAEIVKEGTFEIVVEGSKKRCYKDEEYEAAGIPVTEDVGDADLLLGIKEVPVDALIPGKLYMMFSHTIKKQARNKKLLQAVLEKKIHLIDYEPLIDANGRRVIGFGYWAGMVGAHNALYTFGERSGLFSLPRMMEKHDFEEITAYYHKTTFPAVRIVLTGHGRVGQGAKFTLESMGIREVTPLEYLSTEFNEPVFTQLSSSELH